MKTENLEAMLCRATGLTQEQLDVGGRLVQANEKVLDLRDHVRRLRKCLQAAADRLDYYARLNARDARVVTEARRMLAETKT